MIVKKYIIRMIKGDFVLDFRLLTFLELCKTMNYTKTASNLNLTQPAVTQHIQYLESKYNIKLFSYHGKKLSLTTQGSLLLELVKILKTNSDSIIRSVKNCESDKITIKMGVTSEIAEYFMFKVLRSYLKLIPNSDISVYVENKDELIKKLENGEISFIFIEGQFNKNEYIHYLFKYENYIPICSSNYNLTKDEIDFNELINERIIAREQGSSSRNILEGILNERGIGISSFKSIIEVGSITLLKQLVLDGLGIAFVFETVVKEELKSKMVRKINVSNFYCNKEFNFVCLKGSMFKEQYIDFCEFCKNVIKESHENKILSD